MQTHMHQQQNGTSGDDMLHTTRGGVFAHGGNDTIMATAQNGLAQIHTYAADGHDLTVMAFNTITKFSHGHHVRGGDGGDVFNFVDIHNVQDTIVGRIEDYDPTQDQIRIEGKLLELNNLPSYARLVKFNGESDFDGDAAQQWLLLATAGGGHIFYALEGARIDARESDDQEPHFLLSEPDFAAMEDISYEDRENYIPAGVTAVGGARIQDTDATFEDMDTTIRDTMGGDLIAAGLNNDRVMADFGYDRVWAGSGDDFVFTGRGNDTISGGTGNDTLRAGSGADSVEGGDGDDFIVTGSGADYVDGGRGDDFIEGKAGFDFILGGEGHDTIDGGHRHDTIDGGAGQDVMTGGTHKDEFHFNDFDAGFDRITDFERRHDSLHFSGQVDGFEDIVLTSYDDGGTASTLIQFRDGSGTLDVSMGGIVLEGITIDRVASEDFNF